MPEGPEVWILSKAINKFFTDENKTISYGKHLFQNNEKEDWSFGLTGKVLITETSELIKISSGYVCGSQVIYSELNEVLNKLGLDWMCASKELLKLEVEKWKKSKKLLAGLLLDQSKISGIGVAWGSEILQTAKLSPSLKACDQDLDLLVDAMVKVRDDIKEVYSSELERYINALSFVNNWFKNLYDVRNIKVYKMGTKIQILGRSWWVNLEVDQVIIDC